MNKLKFIVAVFGITIATFGTISKSNAKSVEIGGRSCLAGGVCGYDSSGHEKPGHD